MKSRAFTLVEVMISIALIAIALLGVMGAIAYGTRHSTSGEQLSEASHIARSMLTFIQERTLLDSEPDEEWPTPESGLNDSESTFRQIDDPPFNGLFKGSQLEKFRRQIRSQRVSQDPLNYRYNLARVKVSILWSSKQGERQVDITGLVTISRD